MSGASKPKRGSRLGEAFALVLLCGVLWGVQHLAPHAAGQAQIIASLGFLLLAATLTSELVEVLRVPHLTGYILAGLVAGPNVLHLVSHEALVKLSPVNTLTLALIALAGGVELKLGTLKQNLRSLAVAMGLQAVVVLGATAGTFLLLRSFVPFVAALPLAAASGVALLWGVLAISRSPSATLAILTQTRAKGPLVDWSLGFVMSSDVVVVVFLAAAMSVARPLVEPGATLSFGAFRELGHELLGSVSLGTTLGLVLAAYLRLVGKGLLVVLLLLGFGMTEVLHYLRFDPPLTFLVAGFVVQNLSKQGDKFLHAIERTSSVVYVAFFAMAGAHLDVPLLKTLWPVALGLAGARALATFGAARLASRLARDEEPVRTWAVAPLVSQAGLTLGLSAVIARAFPSFGPGFQSLAVATVAVNEIAGPVLFKLALDRTGESQGPVPALSADDGATGDEAPSA